jgi:hypothetical protein
LRDWKVIGYNMVVGGSRRPQREENLPRCRAPLCYIEADGSSISALQSWYNAISVIGPTAKSLA